MTSLVNAARQLVEQVQALNPKAAVSAGAPDGYGRLRSVEFDARTSKWLVPALNAVADPRVSRIDYEDKGRAVVHFVGDTRADTREPYALEVALRVLKEKD